MRACLRSAAVAAVVLAAPLVRAEAPPQDIAKVRREIALLEARLDLANGDKFYLVLSPTVPSLKLMLKGAVLQEYPIEGVEIGSQRVAFAARSAPAGWRGRIFGGGNLVPPRALDRLEMIAPPPSKNADEDNAPAVPIPQTPEEKYPVPNRYHVRFDGGISLEVRRAGDQGEKDAFWAGVRKKLEHWWADAKAVLSRSSDADELRVRVTLRAADADSLYRALPPDTRLLVLPDAE